MSKKRRNHSPEFKSKVALAAIKGDQTLSELSRQYGINSNLIVKWKKQLIEQSSEVFASGKGLARIVNLKFKAYRQRLVS